MFLSMIYAIVLLIIIHTQFITFYILSIVIRITIEAVINLFCKHTQCIFINNNFFLFSVSALLYLSFYYTACESCLPLLVVASIILGSQDVAYYL